MPCLIGQMSGTSADALDLVALSCSDFSYLAHHSYPYHSRLKTALHSVVQQQEDPQNLINLLLTDFMIEKSEHFLSALNLEVKAIGLHGHTLKHDPDNGVTTTLMMPQKIADCLNIPVIAEMRLADVEAGGQGAPLTPLFHQKCFAEKNKHVGVLNLGGIANLSVLKGECIVEGFDIGPANTLMDWVCRTQFNCDFDLDGAFACSGNVNKKLLNEMLKTPYFAKKPPKSTGREYFNETWLNVCLSKVEELNKNNLMATLNALVCQTVHDSIQLLPTPLDHLIVCGGGVNNLHLMNTLRQTLKTKVYSSEDCGWPVTAIEGAAWAWLAAERLLEHRKDTQNITGARQPVLLGNVYQPIKRL